MSKPYNEMTVEELKEEHKMWDDRIKGAKSWGASLAVADEFRSGIRSELLRRGINIDDV